MAIYTEVSTHKGDRWRVEIGGLGGTYYKAATDQPITLEADSITWLIDKVQCTRATLRLWVKDPSEINDLVTADTAPSVVIKRNGVVYWCGWLDMEGIELQDDDAKGHVMELYFGDFAPLKQRRFARRGVLSIIQILSEAVNGLPVTYSIATDKVDAVDTALLDDDCTYYDALELVAEATLCTVTQMAGVVYLTNPLVVRSGHSAHIGKIYGDDNRSTTGRLINTITYHLEVPTGNSKDGGIDAITPRDVKRHWMIDYFEATPSPSQTRYTSHPGRILGIKKQGRAAWQYGSIISSPRIGQIGSGGESNLSSAELDKIVSALRGTTAPLLVIDGDLIDAGSNVPIKIAVALRGGAVTGYPEEQQELSEAASSLSISGAKVMTGITLCVQLVNDSGAPVASLREIVYNPGYTAGKADYLIKPLMRYEWSADSVHHRVHLYADGIGSGSQQAKEPYMYGSDKWGDGLLVPRPTSGYGGTRLRVTLYQGASIKIAITEANGALMIDYLLSMAVLALLACERKGLPYYLLADNVTIDQPVMNRDDKDVRYDVTAYLSKEVAEQVTYDTRVAGLPTIPAWGYKGKEPYQGFLPADLFGALYPIYGVRGVSRALRIHGAPAGYYYDYIGGSYIATGYTADLYADRTDIQLQTISDDDYDGQEDL